MSNSQFSVPLSQAQKTELIRIQATIKPFLDGENRSTVNGLFAPVYRFVNQQIDAGLIRLPNGASGLQTQFWFANAEAINSGQLTPSNFVIREITRLGLQYDGLRTNDRDLLAKIQTTSNSIGYGVLEGLLKEGVRDVRGMLEADIGQAIAAGSQTLAGWGGSFFYWDIAVSLDPANPRDVRTIGQRISQDPVELTKFQQIVPEAFARALVYGPSQATMDYISSALVFASAKDRYQSYQDVLIFQNIERVFLTRLSDLAISRGTTELQQFLNRQTDLFFKRNNMPGLPSVSSADLTENNLAASIGDWIYPNSLASTEPGSNSPPPEAFLLQVREALAGRDLSGLQVFAARDGNPILIFQNGDILQFSRTGPIVGNRTVQVDGGGTLTTGTDADGTTYDVSVSADRSRVFRRNYDVDQNLASTLETLTTSDGETETKRDGTGVLETYRTIGTTAQGDRRELVVSQNGTQIETVTKPDGTLVSRIETSFSSNGKVSVENLSNGKTRELIYTAQVPAGGGPPTYALANEIIRYTEYSGTVQVVERYDNARNLLGIDRVRVVALAGGVLGTETIVLDTASRTQTVTVVAPSGTIVSTETTRTFTAADNQRLSNLVSGLGDLNGAYQQWRAGNRLQGAIQLSSGTVNIIQATGGTELRQSLGGVGASLGATNQLLNLDQVFSSGGNEGLNVDGFKFLKTDLVLGRIRATRVGGNYAK
jgi:hypothetical protein